MNSLSCMHPMQIIPTMYLQVRKDIHYTAKNSETYEYTVTGSFADWLVWQDIVRLNYQCPLIHLRKMTAIKCQIDLPTNDTR